jgi:ribosome maturation factor RimP
LFGGAPWCACGGETIVTGILRERLIALIEPLLQRLGYELVELEYSAGRAHATLRLFIDRDAGVTLDDCAQVSREVSTLLDVEDPIPSAYTLEVSSPGFDRVLRTQAHFGRFVGSRVFVELKEPRAGRRRYTGKLLTVDEAGIALEVDREHVTVSFAEIGKARLAS